MAATQTMPKVVSQEEWLKARKELLVKEKEHTRAGDALAKQRRDIGMVEVTKDYKFSSSDSSNPKPTLLDLFGDKQQLIIYHLMYNPSHEKPCKGCSLHADSIGHFEHLNYRDTSLVCISRAPVEKIEGWKKRVGWTFPWVSSGDSTFNYDFHVTHDPNVQTEYNYKPFEWRDLEAKKKGDDEDMPGTSVFFRDGEKVFHTYSSYARGGEQLITTYAYLDITPLGRQEKGTGIEEFKYHDEY